MKIHLKIPRQIYQLMMADLVRPHSHAYERIGFCKIRLGSRGADTQYLLVTDYWPVADNQYVKDERSGARINSTAIRTALQTALTTGEGILHIHMHDFPGLPRFSKMDLEEIPRIVESLINVNPDMPHGMLVLGPELATANAVLPGAALQKVDRITIVGHPTTVINTEPLFFGGDRFSRQGFLGLNSPAQINSLKIGLVGLSGGGSHVVQQLSHLGFANFVLFDAQTIELSNLARLVGATEEDVAQGLLKIAIADRIVNNINSLAITQPIAARWQEHPEALRNCDIVFGCLDGFDERRQLESACRRYLIPLIDIGMDVICIAGQPPRLGGQVILSLPGYPCMQCIGFLNERNLTEEAQKYGDAGINPQVVWSNGVLASTAVGIVVDLTTAWTQTSPGLIYKGYDGNSLNLTDHPRFEHVRHKQCTHYKISSIGDP